MKKFSVLFLLIFLSACFPKFNNADSLLYEADGYVINTKSGTSFDKIWKGIFEVISQEKIELLSESKNPNSLSYVKLKSGVSMFSWGEYAAIYVKKNRENRGYTIKIISKRKVSTNFFAKDWSKHLGQKLESVL